MFGDRGFYFFRFEVIWLGRCLFLFVWRRIGFVQFSRQGRGQGRIETVTFDGGGLGEVASCEFLFYCFKRAFWEEEGGIRRWLCLWLRGQKFSRGYVGRQVVFGGEVLFGYRLFVRLVMEQFCSLFYFGIFYLLLGFGNLDGMFL